MKKSEIAQENFEELVRKIIAGELTRKEIAKEYHISARRLNLIITELSKTNPKLYQEFIAKFPYKPKEITNVNFVELTKQIMKEKQEIEVLSVKYGVSTRTIRRRISHMKGSKEIDESTEMTLDEIYDLYKRYREEELSLEDIEKIETMHVGIVQDTKEVVEHRRRFLEDLINKYHQYIDQGIPKKQVAEKLGYSFIDIYKKEGELRRIIIEAETRKGIEQGECGKENLTIPSKSAKEKMKRFKKGLEFSGTIETPLTTSEDNGNALLESNQKKDKKAENRIDETEVTVEEK